jgi:hypothetical protein
MKQKHGLQQAQRAVPYGKRETAGFDTTASHCMAKVQGCTNACQRFASDPSSYEVFVF